MENFKGSEGYNQGITLRATNFYSSGWYDSLEMVQRYFPDKDFSYSNIVGGDSGSHLEEILPSQDKLAPSSPLGTMATKEIEDVSDTAKKAVSS